MKPPKLPQGTVVWVEWLDSFGPAHNEWMSVAEASPEDGFDGHCTSVGFVIASDSHWLTVACSEHSGYGSVLGAISIPWVAMASLEVLKDA